MAGVLPSKSKMLRAWASTDEVDFIGTEISKSRNFDGFGLSATEAITEPGSVLLRVHKTLILSIETVRRCAQTDKHLREMLEACNDFAKTPRGAILIFLFLQIYYPASESSTKTSKENALTQYVTSLPTNVPLPTRWIASEQALLEGTSLKPAVTAKLKSLRREVGIVFESMKDVQWFKHGRGSEDHLVFFNNWLVVDAMFRSRALDLPGTGHAMVPCIDMANHASGEETLALYETDDDGNAVLLLRNNKSLQTGDEITISYGDEKGACEMLFSYGFIDSRMESAQQLLLGLEVPEDDPLRDAKHTISNSPPGVRLFSVGQDIRWESPFIWLLCVNEEDGLGFEMAKDTSGQHKLVALWKEEALEDTSSLEQVLRSEPNWEVFNLRAHMTIESRIIEQLEALRNKGRSSPFGQRDSEITVKRLCQLEEKLLNGALAFVRAKARDLSLSDVVQQYLSRHQEYMH